jgi:hypothetical protein
MQAGSISPSSVSIESGSSEVLHDPEEQLPEEHFELSGTGEHEEDEEQPEQELICHPSNTCQKTFSEQIIPRFGPECNPRTSCLFEGKEGISFYEGEEYGRNAVNILG